MRLCMEEQMAMGLRGGGAGEDARCVLTWDALPADRRPNASWSIPARAPARSQYANEVADACSRTRCSIMGAQC